MKKRTLLLTLAAAVLVWGFGALEAKAAQVLLPAPLSDLLVPGSFAVVGPEPDTFSNFTYSTSPIGSPPAASGITVSEFHLGGSPTEDGITFSGALFAAPGTVVDYAISYVVTAPAGFSIFDAHLSGVFSTFGGTGAVSVGETLLNASTGALLGTLEISSPPGSVADTIDFAGVTSILVLKDIILVGGSNGASISIINQGYSSAGTVPEPASMSLLGIGMSGFFAFRRFFKKRTTVA